MLGVTIASTVGFGHLLVRQGRAPSPAPAPNTTNDPTPAPVRTSAPLLSTEVVFLLVLVACGTVYAVQSGEPGVANRQATAGSGEWTTYRGDDRRTGAVDPDDAGPVRPELLWSFDPAPRRGSVSLHSSPTVVDGLCYVGALHEVSALVQGHVYCVNVADGRKIGETTLKAGELVWRFTAEDELRPVFSSPSVRDGRVYFGEGYHQNKNCRLFCLEAGSGEKPVWVHKTASHVESCPVLVGDRIYIGAGDDGLVCLDLSATKTGGAPTVAWQTKEVHVDSSPVVAAGKVIAGGVTGDVVTTLAVIAADAETGEIAWRVPTEVPVPGCPAFLDGRVYVTLGNGKLNQAADRPTGAVLCLDVADGRQIWRHPLETSVLSTAAVGPTGVVAADTWGLVTALDPVTGSVRWRANLDDPIVASPVATKTRVFVATLSGIVHALDAATGDVVWSFAGLKTAAEDVYASPVLVGGRLYVAAGGKLHCLGDRKTP
jgi:outer membrane protein assembly factor BamB